MWLKFAVSTEDKRQITFALPLNIKGSSDARDTQNIDARDDAEDLGEEANDDASNEVADKTENSAEEGADKATNFDKLGEDLGLDRDGDNNKDVDESTKDELQKGINRSPSTHKKPIPHTFNRQARKLAMATASRTPPTRVQRILSSGREARALTLTVTVSTAA